MQPVDAPSVFPSFSWNFLGNDAAVSVLQRAIAGGHVSHAYLLTGAEGVGKATLARLTIQSLFCAAEYAGATQQPEKIPCGVCAQCRQVTSGAHPDLLWIEREKDAEDGTIAKNITVEAVRELSARLSGAPLLSRWKAAVIDGAEFFSAEAGNALLKTLEEPRGRTVIFLLARHASGVLPTLRSRCQILRLSPVPFGVMYDFFREHGHEAPSAQEMAALASRRPARAMEMLRTPEAFAEIQKQVQLFVSFATRPLAQRFLLADETILSRSEDHAQARGALAGVFDLWLSVLRDILLLRLGNAAPDSLQRRWYREPLTALAEKMSPAAIVQKMSAVVAAKDMLSKNGNHRLVTEHILLTL